MSGVSRAIDPIEVTFDDPNLVANAGLVIVATLVARLGLEQLIAESLRRAWALGAGPGSRFSTL